MSDRQKLVEIVERILASEGRLTAGESMDLDYAHDQLDEWLEGHETGRVERVRQMHKLTTADASSRVVCRECYQPQPCATIRVLDGGEG